MALGTWDPTGADAAGGTQIEPVTLERFIAYSRDDQLEQLEDLIVPQESQSLAGLMQIDHELWQGVAQDLEPEQIIHLIRFFAMAENLPGWEAGERSPVIPLAKVLRKRGQKLERELLLWLRQVNDNRFLPYGPL
jgi:hypothetical protein